MNFYCFKNTKDVSFSEDSPGVGTPSNIQKLGYTFLETMQTTHKECKGLSALVANAHTAALSITVRGMRPCLRKGPDVACVGRE